MSGSECDVFVHGGRVFDRQQAGDGSMWTCGIGVLDASCARKKTDSILTLEHSPNMRLNVTLAHSVADLELPVRPNVRDSRNSSTAMVRSTNRSSIPARVFPAMFLSIRPPAHGR